MFADGPRGGFLGALNHEFGEGRATQRRRVLEAALGVGRDTSLESGMSSRCGPCHGEILFSDIVRQFAGRRYLFIGLRAK